MSMEKKGLHVREHGSLLADLEKRLLVWVANRLPAGITSDHLTLLGLGGMLLAGLSYWVAREYPPALILVVIALALNWFGDSLDGTLARVRNRQRPRYGFYVDHIIDVVGTFFLLSGLALSGYMNPFIALGVLILFLMVEAELFLATHVHAVFRLSFLKVGPTELRILLVAGTLWILYRPGVIWTLAGYRLTLFDVGGLVAVIGLAIALIVSTIRNTIALYRAEPIPQ